MAIKHTTREGWFHAAVDYMRPWYAELGHEIPEVYVSIGFPSGGARSNAIGECHYMGKDGNPQIFIHPEIEDGPRALDIFMHELVHAIMPLGTGHGKAFGKLAKGLGLTGKMTATVATPELAWTLGRLEARGLGDYPHSALSYGPGGRKKQGNRQLKVICGTCIDDDGKNYVIRMTRKWLDELGAPICPQCKTQMLEAG